MSTMNRKQLILVVCLFAAACAPRKTRKNASTEPNPMSPVFTAMHERGTELQEVSTRFSAGAKNLPGRNTTEDRTLSADAFDRAGAALAILGGPRPGGALRQNLRLMDNTPPR